MTQVSFPVHELRTFSYGNGIKRLITEVAVTDLPELPTEANARAQNLRTGVSRRIRHSLSEEGSAEVFHLLNRGIVVTAAQAAFDNSTRILTLDLRDTAVHGVIDGGHTYAICREHAESNPFSPARVMMEVLVGVEDFQPDIVGSRNTSVQVDAPSLLNVEGKFEPILDHLNRTGLPRDLIKVRMNEDKDIEIVDILSIMYLFDVDRFGNDMSGFDKPPILAFTGKASVTNHFRDNTETFTQRMLPLLPDILYLWDYVALRAQAHYRSGTGNERGRIGARRGARRIDSDHGTYIRNVTLDHNPPKAYRLMLMAAVRCLVDASGPQYKWRELDLPELPADVEKVLGRKGTPIERFYEAVAPDLHRQLWPAADGNSPSQVGKQSMLWNNLYMIALRYMLGRLSE